MKASVIAFVVAWVLLLAVKFALVEGIVLGIAWIVGQVASIPVNYSLIAWIVAGFWGVIILAQILILAAHGNLMRQFTKY